MKQIPIDYYLDKIHLNIAQQILDEANIATVIRNDYGSVLPHPTIGATELWVMDNNNYQKAIEILSIYFRENY